MLDLSSNGIDNFQRNIFDQLPSLELLDLSHNLLLEFKVDVLQPLQKLKLLILKDNSFKCMHDRPPEWLIDLKNFTSNNGIRFQEKCVKIARTEKFLKMVIEEKPAQKNSWLLEEDSESRIFNKNNTFIVCENVTFVPANKTQNIYLQYLMQIIELSPPLFILFLFVFGFAVGK